MPKRSEQYFVQRKHELADAAMRCFTRKGYHAASIPDICSEAGVSIGTLYKYFDGKRDMWMACFETELESWQAEVAGKNWVEFRNRMIKGMARLDDGDRLRQLASSLEFTADALRDRDYADWAGVYTQRARDIITHELKRLHATGEISLPLGVGTTERMLRSLLAGAVMTALQSGPWIIYGESLLGLGLLGIGALLLTGALRN